MGDAYGDLPARRAEAERRGRVAGARASTIGPRANRGWIAALLDALGEDKSLEDNPLSAQSLALPQLRPTPAAAAQPRLPRLGATSPARSMSDRLNQFFQPFAEHPLGKSADLLLGTGFKERADPFHIPDDVRGTGIGPVGAGLGKALVGDAAKLAGKVGANQIAGKLESRAAGMAPSMLDEIADEAAAGLKRAEDVRRWSTPSGEIVRPDTPLTDLPASSIIQPGEAPAIQTAKAAAAKAARAAKPPAILPPHSIVAPYERSEQTGGRLLVSTRVPWAKNVQQAAGPLFTGVAEVGGDPVLQKKMAELARTYPFLTTSERRMNDRGVLDAAVERSAQNIDALMNMLPEEHARRSAGWYQGAHDLSNTFAQEFGFTPDQAAAVIASQSPSKDWHQNVDLARRIMHGYNELNQRDEPFTAELHQRFADSTRVSAAAWNQEKKLTGEAAAKTLARAEQKIYEASQQIGKGFQSLDDMNRGRVLRAWSEATDPEQRYAIWTPEGAVAMPVAMKGKNRDVPRSVVWQSYDNIENALSVLRDKSDENISRRVGEGHKVRSFFNNINVPTDIRSVTVDTHNVGGGHLRPMGGKAPEVKSVMGGTPGSAALGISGLHPVFRDAVTMASGEHGLRPHQAQSVSWEAIKGLFSPAQRRDKDFKAQVNQIWNEYRRGTIPVEEVHGRIFSLARPSGELAPPEWAGFK